MVSLAASSFIEGFEVEFLKWKVVWVENFGRAYRMIVTNAIRITTRILGINMINPNASVAYPGISSNPAATTIAIPSATSNNGACLFWIAAVIRLKVALLVERKRLSPIAAVAKIPLMVKSVPT